MFLSWEGERLGGIEICGGWRYMPRGLFYVCISFVCHRPRQLARYLEESDLGIRLGHEDYQDRLNQIAEWVVSH